MKANLPALEGLSESASQDDVFRSTGHQLAAWREEPDDISGSQRQLEIVRGDDNGQWAFPCQLAQQTDQLNARWQVEKRSRFIQDQQHRFLREGAADHDALPLPVGEATEVAVRKMACADRVNRPVDCHPIPIGNTSEPSRVRIAPQLDDAANGQGLHGDAFGEHHTKTAREIDLCDRAKIRAAQFNAAPQRRLHPGERPQQRRLPDAVWAEKTHEFPRLHGKVHVLEHRTSGAARAIADSQIARAQRGRHPANAPRRLRSSTATTTGAPISEVTAFSGSTPALPGRSDTICATSAPALPISTTAGTRTR